MADIVDGYAYKTLQRGPLMSHHSITVILNTDGVVVFKSTNYTIWPVLLMINEHPLVKGTSKLCYNVAWLIIIIAENSLKIWSWLVFGIPMKNLKWFFF